MNNENNNEFDLFAPPVDDNLKEELAKGQHQWTNKYTKVLAGAVLVVTLLSAGAWYGHHSAVSATTNNIAGLRSAFGGGGFGGGFGSGAGASGAASAATGGFAGGGGGFGGVRITGKISKVSGATVTVTLDDPTQGASLKAGDTARVTDTAGFGGGAPGSTGAASGTPQVGGAPAATGRTRSSGSPSTKVPTTGGAVPSGRPAIAGGGAPSGGGGGGRGAFNNPAFTDCLTKEGVTLTPGTRPDRTDPKVAAALQKCFATLGGGFGGGPGGGGTSGGTGGTGG